MLYKILKEGEQINTIVADEAFVTAYCEENGYTFEELEETEPVAPEPAAPTVEEQLAELQSQVKTLEAKNTALTTSNQFLEDCIAEMAETVYQ